MVIFIFGHSERLKRFNMQTKPITIVQIATNADHLYGLDDKGQVWWRAKIPYSGAYTTTRKKDEDDETVWKSLSMKGRIDGPALAAEREIPTHPEDPDNFAIPRSQDFGPL